MISLFFLGLAAPLATYLSAHVTQTAVRTLFNADKDMGLLTRNILGHMHGRLEVLFVILFAFTNVDDIFIGRCFAGCGSFKKFQMSKMRTYFALAIAMYTILFIISCANVSASVLSLTVIFTEIMVYACYASLIRSTYSQLFFIADTLNNFADFIAGTLVGNLHIFLVRTFVYNRASYHMPEAAGNILDMIAVSLLAWLHCHVARKRMNVEDRTDKKVINFGLNESLPPSSWLDTIKKTNYFPLKIAVNRMAHVSANTLVLFILDVVRHSAKTGSDIIAHFGPGALRFIVPVMMSIVSLCMFRLFKPSVSFRSGPIWLVSLLLIMSGLAFFMRYLGSSVLDANICYVTFSLLYVGTLLLCAYLGPIAHKNTAWLAEARGNAAMSNTLGALIPLIVLVSKMIVTELAMLLFRYQTYSS